MLPHFNIYHKPMIIKITRCQRKNRHRPTEQNGEFRNNPTRVQAASVWQRPQAPTMGKGWSLKLSLGNAVPHTQKNDNWTLTLYHTQKSTRNG